MKKLLFNTETHYSKSLNLGLLSLRLGAGLIMAFGHGLGKLPPSEGFIGFVGSIGFPSAILFAWLAALSEFVGGLFVSLGLATRVSSLFLALTMAGAAFGAHGADPFAKQEKAILYLIMFLTMFFTGPGKYSVDALIDKK
jgi:putative oxidoreductase